MKLSKLKLKPWGKSTKHMSLPSLSAHDSTYQAEPIPIMSEMVFPNAAAAIVEIPSLAPWK